LRALSCKVTAGFNAATVVAQGSGDVEHAGCQGRERRDRRVPVPGEPVPGVPVPARRCPDCRRRPGSGRTGARRGTGAGTRRDAGHVADAALQIADIGRLQLQRLRSELFNAAATIAQRIGVHFDAARIERATTIVDVYRGLHAQLRARH
jgi:hypothetical protein